MDGMTGPYLADGLAQSVDMLGEQPVAAVGEGDGEEKGTAILEVASVVGHGLSLA